MIPVEVKRAPHSESDFHLMLYRPVHQPSVRSMIQCRRHDWTGPGLKSQRRVPVERAQVLGLGRRSSAMRVASVPG